MIINKARVFLEVTPFGERAWIAQVNGPHRWVTSIHGSWRDAMVAVQEGLIPLPEVPQWNGASLEDRRRQIQFALEADGWRRRQR